MDLEIVELNPAYTSQECYSCGYVDKSNRQSQSEFKCKCCGKELMPISKVVELIWNVFRASKTLYIKPWVKVHNP